MGRLCLIAVLATFSISAYSMPVVWTLNGTFGSTGGTASGTFTYDADTNTYSDLNIQTFTPGGDTVAVFDMSSSILAATVYGQPDQISIDGYDALSPTSAAFVGFQFAGPLTNAGGTVGVVNGSEDWTQSYNPISGIYGQTTQYNYSGFVTAAAVPLPAAAWLFGSAVGVLGWLRRKQAV